MGSPTAPADQAGGPGGSGLGERDQGERDGGGALPQPGEERRGQHGDDVASEGHGQILGSGGDGS
jgi:hypothetical protein